MSPNSLSRDPISLPYSGVRHIALALLIAGLLAGPASGKSPKADDPHLQQALRTVDSLRTAGDFRTALTRLYNLNREHPESAEVLWRYAILWSDYGKAAETDKQAASAYRQALTMADRAIAADPNSAWAHLSKAAAAGRAALLTGSNKESLRLSRQIKDHADRAIELDSGLAPAYYVRGVWHSEVADLGVFKRVVVKTVYGGLPEASLEQATEDLRRAVELEPRTYSHLELGKVYMKMGRTEAAREQFQDTLEAPPADPFAPRYKLEARTLLRKLN